MALTAKISPSFAEDLKISPPPTPRFTLTVPRINEITYMINVKNTDNSSSIARIDFAMPKTWIPDTYVELKEIKTTYSFKNYSDRENTYMYSIMNLGPNETAHVNITFYSLKYKLEYYTHKRVQSISYPSEYMIYTQPEEYIESNDPLTINKAESLVGNRTNPFRIAERIYDYVISYLAYMIQPEIRGALWALQNGRGDCTEYGTLFVALMRAVGIPARTVTGHVSSRLSEGGIVNATRLWVDSPHLWSEFYVGGYGWVPVDPTFGEGDPWDHFGIVWSQYLPFLKGPTMNEPYRSLFTLKPSSINYTTQLLVTPLTYLLFTNQAVLDLYSANSLANVLRRTADQAHDYGFNITEAYPHMQNTYDSLYNATQTIEKNSTEADIFARNAFQNATETLQLISKITTNEARIAINNAWRELRLLGALSGETYIKRGENYLSNSDYADFLKNMYYGKTSASQAPNVFVFIGPLIFCGFTIWALTHSRRAKKG